MIVRGTTPYVSFTLPFDVSILKNAYITFSQNDNVIVEKNLSDCIKNQNVLEVKLTQEDTLKFKALNNVEIQIRGITNEGEAIASEIRRTYIYKIHKDGVI